MDEAWTQAPMKVYRGRLIADLGNEVTIEDGLGRVQMLGSEHPIADYSWGMKGHTQGEANLALAILADAMGNLEEARKYYQRFKHRTVALWSPSTGWSITARDVLAVVEVIKQVERENVQARAIVNSQVAPIVSEAGGFPGAPILRSPKDQGPGPIVEQPADPDTKAARQRALAKLTDAERRALGL